MAKGGNELRTRKGGTLYKSSQESNKPNIQAFPPVEAEKSVAKKCMGQTHRQADRQGDCNI